MGFVLEPEEAERLIEKSARNSDVLFPYLNGEDLNSRPDQSPSRWVINFFDWPIERAMEYPDCFHIIEEKVKAERLVNKYSRTAREKWWLYERLRAELYDAISGLERVLVIPETTKYCAFSLSSTSLVFSHMTKVVALGDYASYSILSSSVHEEWARYYSSTLETRLKYIISDAFETFPFPARVTNLDAIGKSYHDHRRQIMLARQEGVTKTYNRFHDPDKDDADIRKLREHHFEMDKAVAAAYGWTDLDLGHGFHETKQGLRFTISESARREVLGRLLKLNHERYAEEKAKGLHDKKGKGKGSGSGEGRRASKKQPAEASLFGGDDDEQPPGSDGEPDNEGQAEAKSKHEDSRKNQTEAAQAGARPPSIDEFDTDAIMATFRQTARGQGWKGRDDLLKEVSLALGYQRLGPKIEEALRGHLRAAIRRKIIESDGDLVRLGAATMEQYDLEDLRATLCSVMRAGRRYEREEVVHAVAHYLGFARVTDSVRQSMKSAINSGIRQGILSYEANLIWRE
jgi:hypothetical protein